VIVGADNGYVITGEDLQSALFANMLAGALSHTVVMTIGTLNDGV